MQIAMCCHPTQGGSGVVASELAVELGKRGHGVHVVAWNRPFRLAEDAPGVYFHRVEMMDYPLFKYPPFEFALTNRLVNLVTEFGVEVIHAHYAIPHAIAALMARCIVEEKHTVKVVTTLHGTDITLVGSHRDFFEVTRHAMNRSDAVTAVSQWLAHRTVETFSLERPPSVIPNFVCTDRFNPEGRASYPARGEPFVLFHASNMRPVKRVTSIIRIFALVRRELNARLLLCGDGPERGMAEELTAQLGIEEDVRFLKPVPALAELYKKAHLYVLFSKYESFGLSALEAMACGTPVAGTKSGGLVEVVEDGTSGLLLEPLQEEEAARRIVSLLSDGKAWERMSREASRSAAERFSAERILPLYESLYRKVTEKGG